LLWLCSQRDGCSFLLNNYANNNKPSSFVALNLLFLLFDETRDPVCDQKGYYFNLTLFFLLHKKQDTIKSTQLCFLKKSNSTPSFLSLPTEAECPELHKKISQSNNLNQGILFNFAL
jgi:hypothetical protein